VASGNTQSNGITLLTTLPGLAFLELGVNVGVETFTADATSPVCTRNDLVAGAASDWGAPADLTTTAPVLGIAARCNLLKAETKTVTTVIGAIAGLNFVQFQDVAVLGTQEALGAIAPALPKTIDPVSSYTNLTVMLNAAIWF
jgi:hypothetical protein